MKSDITCYLTSSPSLAGHALPPNNQATLPSLSEQADHGTWCWLVKDKNDMAPGTSWYSVSLPHTPRERENVWEEVTFSIEQKQNMAIIRKPKSNKSLF